MSITLIYAGQQKITFKATSVETIFHGNDHRTHEAPADFSPCSSVNQMFGLFSSG